MHDLLTSPDNPQRALVIRLARVHTPEHSIAFLLGLTAQKLHELYAHEMRQAILTADLEIRETLFAMAKSGKHPAATIFWFKTHSSGHPPKKSPEKQSTPKQTFRTGMPPPGFVRFIGPNGEIVT